MVAFSVRQRLQQLDEEMEQKTLHGLGGSSVKSFRTHVNAYVEFCILFGLHLFTVTVTHFRRYITHLQRTHKSVESIKNYVSGVKKLFYLVGIEPPDLSDYLYNLTLRGILRDKDHVVRRANPVTPELLAAMFQHVDVNSEVQLVAWVAILLGFYMFFRKSNLVPDSISSFNLSKHLSRGNIYKWGDIFIVRVFWAKNVQFHERELIIPLLPNIDKRICPVYWLQHMLDNLPGVSSDPALLTLRNDKVTPLTYGQLTYWLRKWVQSAGLDPKLFSSHSLRRGGATWAARCGLPSHVIRLLGDWRSQAFLKYIDMTLQSKFEAMITFNMCMF